MQQLHQGQVPASANITNDQRVSQEPKRQLSHVTQPTPLSANASSLDDLISGAANDANKAEALSTDRKEEKKAAKKDKDKSTKLVYSDNDISPEEKMAQLPRYAFVPSAS